MLFESAMTLILKSFYEPRPQHIICNFHTNQTKSFSLTLVIIKTSYLNKHLQFA